jgi:hypothetical protein
MVGKLAVVWVVMMEKQKVVQMVAWSELKMVEKMAPMLVG